MYKYYLFYQILVRLMFGDMNKDEMFDTSDASLILETYTKEACDDENLILYINGILDITDASLVLV